MKGTLESHIERMEAEEFVARAFVALGVLVWGGVAVAMAIMGATQAFYAYGLISLFCLAVLAVGWNFERTAAGVSLAGAVALIAYGIAMGWDVALWIIVGASVGLELVLAAAMFFAARHEIVVVERTAVTPMKGAHA